MARITISIPDELQERVDDRLAYGDSRSQWIQEAIEEKLERESGDAENRSPATVVAD